MIRKEPALVAAVLAALVQAALMFFTGNVSVDIDWLLPFLTLVAGYLTRQSVMPVSTIRDAGMTPAEVHEAADDPNIRRAEGK